MLPAIVKLVLEMPVLPGVKYNLQVAPGARLTHSLASCVTLPARSVSLKFALIFFAAIVVE